MKSFYKTIAIVAACLLALGALLCGVSLAAGVTGADVQRAVNFGAVGRALHIGSDGWIVGWGAASSSSSVSASSSTAPAGGGFAGGTQSGAAVSSAPAAAASADPQAAAVRELEIDLGGGSYRIVTGDRFDVQITGMDQSRVRSGFDGDKWYVEAPSGKTSFADLDGVRGTITIPADCQIQQLELHCGAGEFTADGLRASQSASIEVGAGSLTLTNCALTDAELECGMGSLSLTGTLTGRGSIDCGLGEISVRTAGSAADFGAAVDCGLGTVRFLDQRWNGAGSGTLHQGAANFFTVDCGMGSVDFQTTGGQ